MSDEEILNDELHTLTLLILRTQEQLSVARKIRNWLVSGMFFALSFFIAGLIPLFFL